MEEQKKQIELRALKAPDLFIVSTILSKIGLKEFKECFQSENLKQLIGEIGEDKEANLEKIGMAVVFDIASIACANLAKCEKDIYQLLANLSGLPTKEIANLDGVEFVGLLIDAIKNPANRGFLELASRFQITTK